jgi:hypothetical protein
MQNFLFPNMLVKVIETEAARLDEIKNTILEAQDFKALEAWYIKKLLPTSKKLDSFENLDEAKKYLISRAEKATAQQITKQREHLEAISAAPDFTSMNISVEWSKAWNATAEGRDGHDVYNSGRVGGGGYDKLSTAVANVLNQSPALLKLLYIQKEKAATSKNHDIFGYGSGYGDFPNIEGGVGVSCYYSLFEKVGVTFKQIASGKSFDAFTLVKN